MPDEKIIAVRFPSLYKAVRAFVMDALGIVRNKLGEPTNWPKTYFQQIEFSPPFGANIGWVEKQDFHALMTQIWPEAAALNSYQAACGELRRLKDDGRAIGHFYINDLAGC
jgi:hypothetical protein